MDVLKTVAIDIKESVFENDSDGILYITRDDGNDTYVIAVPVLSFSATVRESHVENDYKWIRNHFPNVGGDYSDNLIQVIKDGIDEF